MNTEKDKASLLLMTSTVNALMDTDNVGEEDIRVSLDVIRALVKKVEASLGFDGRVINR